MLNKEDKKNIQIQIDSADSVAMVSVQKNGMRIIRFIPGKIETKCLLMSGLDQLEREILEGKFENKKERFEWIKMKLK